MATAGDVLDNVFHRLEEDPDSPIFWSRAELLVLLNDGLLEFVLISGYLQSETTYALIGSKLQAVPDTAIGLLNVNYSNKPIERTSIEDVDRSNRRWDYLGGILKQWMPCGLDRFIVDRHPSAATNVTLFTLDAPTSLAEADTIDLDPEYISSLEDYVFAAARFKEGGQEMVDAQVSYDEFAEKSGMREQRSFSQMMVTWSREPAGGNSGGGYATLHRA